MKFNKKIILLFFVLAIGAIIVVTAVRFFMPLMPKPIKNDVLENNWNQYRLDWAKRYSNTSVEYQGLKAFTATDNGKVQLIVEKNGQQTIIDGAFTNPKDLFYNDNHNKEFSNLLISKNGKWLTYHSQPIPQDKGNNIDFFSNGQDYMYSFEDGSIKLLSKITAIPDVFESGNDIEPIEPDGSYFFIGKDITPDGSYFFDCAKAPDAGFLIDNKGHKAYSDVTGWIYDIEHFSFVYQVPTYYLSCGYGVDCEAFSICYYDYQKNTIVMAYKDDYHQLYESFGLRGSLPYTVYEFSTETGKLTKIQ